MCAFYHESASITAIIRLTPCLARLAATMLAGNNDKCAECVDICRVCCLRAPLYPCSVQVGSISKVLLTKQLYKSQMEAMVTAHVFPEFTSPHGFLRARVTGSATRTHGAPFRADWFSGTSLDLCKCVMHIPSFFYEEVIVMRGKLN